MIQPHFTFGHLSHTHFSPWHFCSAGGYLFYLGLDDLSHVDWDHPIGHGGRGAPVVTLSLTLSPLRRYVLAARAISASGIMQEIASAWACLQVTEEGLLAMPPIDGVTDAVATPLANGKLKLEFSRAAVAATTQPDAFDICADVAGATNWTTPLATVPAGIDQDEYRLVLQPSAVHSTLTIRPRVGVDAFGPISTISIAPRPQLAVPTLL